MLAYGQQEIDRAELLSIPLLDLPALDNNKLITKELKNRETIGRSPEFAQPCKVDEGCHQSGQWTIDGDRAIWKMRIKSEGAKSLNFGFTDFYMPTSASFYMTGVTSGERRGPFVSADNDPHDQFWSPIIEDDEVLLELEVDVAQREFVRLHLAKVNHGFIKFGSGPERECFLDVICGAADGWSRNDDYRDIIRSVVMYSINGSRTCTGALINSAREDGTPYILTADHCNVSATNASTIVVYYNFENSTCRTQGSTENGQSGDGQLDVFNSGAEWISATKANVGTDFNLLLLDDPINPSANAYLAGWNRFDVAPDSAIGIHHPYTEEKRISYDDDPLTITDWNNPIINPNGNYLRINSWDNLPTWQGSSGSPLYNSRKQIIGQLWGGGSGCNPPTNPPDGDDYYGRINKSWEGGGSAQTRLKDYLDPDRVGLFETNGVEASATTFHSVPDQYIKAVCKPANVQFTLMTNANFVGSVSYTVVHNPSGASVNIQPINANPGDPVTITVSNTAALANDLYGLRIKTEDSNGNESEIPLWFDVQEAVSGQLSIVAPSDGAMYQITTPTFRWQDLGLSYDLQISSDSAFNTLISSQTNLENPFWETDTDLSVNTKYYWRVRGTTACEEGPWSAISTFTTGDFPGCILFSSNDVPKIINEPTASTITSNLVVSDPGRIASIKVTKIKGLHTYLGDLTFTLISPNGTEVILVANYCETQENFDIGFDDDSELTNPPCPYTDGLIYKPAQSLSAFRGEFASGTWQLKVNDNADADGGQLDEWSLEICTVEDPTVGIAASIDTLVSCAAVDGAVVLTTGSGFSGNVTLSIESTITGIITTLDQTSVTAGSSTNLNVIGTLTHDETVTVRATDGTIVVNKDILLELQSAPSTPSLSAPEDMAMDLPSTVNLSWQTAPNASEYRYQVSTNNTFTDIIATNTITGSSADVNLANGATYFWRVQSINNCDTVSSEVRTFGVSGRFNITISEQTISTCQSSVEYLVTINSGVDGNVNASLGNPPMGSMVSYENNPGTVGQTIKVILSDISLTADVYDMTLTLTDDTGSTVQALQLIVEEAPGLPALTTPANNMGEVDTVPTFQFDLATSATNHDLEVATDIEFNSIVIQSDNLSSGTVEPGILLTPKTTYYWRVKASNSCGVSFSPIYQFLTQVRTGIDDVFEAESVTLVPNPTRDQAEIVIETSVPINGNYTIFGVNGQVLKNGYVTAPRTPLDTSELAEGIYLVRIQDDKSFIVKKLIIF